MNTRERFQAVMSFEPVDRLPAIESYWWCDQTLARWYAEGLPRNLIGHGEVFVRLQIDGFFWFPREPRSRSSTSRRRGATLPLLPAPFS